MRMDRGRSKVGVSWSADHRVVEGAELAAFVGTWRGWFENPQRMIADGVRPPLLISGIRGILKIAPTIHGS